MSHTQSGTIEPCACCMEEVATTPDADLRGLVCEACRKWLRNAVAWLNAAGFHGCRKEAA